MPHCLAFLSLTVSGAHPASIALSPKPLQIKRAQTIKSHYLKSEQSRLAQQKQEAVSGPESVRFCSPCLRPSVPSWEPRLLDCCPGERRWMLSPLAQGLDREQSQIHAS